MKAHYRTKNGQYTVEVDGNNIKEVIKNIATVQEVLEAETQCGMDQCKSVNIRFQVRENDGNEYYELVCKDCGARFEFGQHKKTPTLFPKRSENGKFLPNRGWSKYDGKREKAA
jgi:hypothetical protein